MMLDTPIALFIFNRPEQTRRVFAEIARARPRTLLVVADGPRADRPGEAELCARTREVVETVNWECTVLREYSSENLGCRRRMSSGIDWVFSQCEEAILLEDDCLPEASFFPYCEELLAHYRHDERVTMIGGSDFLPQGRTREYSYRFSHYNLIWGWASWRRAWERYDVEMAAWPAARDGDLLARSTHRPAAERYWRGAFERVYRKEIDTWDLQWMFASWLQKGVSIVPNGNLISNIGFGPEATHSIGDSHLANRPLQAMTFPLRHPPVVEVDAVADRYVSDQVYEWGVPSLGQRAYSRFRAGVSALLLGGMRRKLRHRLRARAQ